MHYLLLQAAQQASSTAPKVLNIQALQTMGTAAGGGAALTPIFSALGQAIKQHPRIKNDWLRWILPLLALVLGVGILATEIRTGYSIDPLTGFLFLGMFLVGAVGADAAYNLLKQTPVLPSGPNNHPADSANASTVTIQTPMTTAVSSVLTAQNSTDSPSTTPTTPNAIPTAISPQNASPGLTGAATTIPTSTPSSSNPSLPPSPFHP